MTSGHTAIVTGANHGIGAATAEALARRGCAVLCTYLRVTDPEDPGIPRRFRDNRAADAAAVIARIEGNGGTAAAVEADLSDPATPVPALRHRRGSVRPGGHPGQQRDRLAGRHLRRRRDRPGRPDSAAGHSGDVDPGSSPSTRWARP